MSKQSIKDKSLVIRQETKQYGNTKDRIADIIDDLNDSKPDIVDINYSSSGLGDTSLDNALLFWCGDSTTWQMTSTGGGFDYMTNILRKKGMPMEKVVGTLNFGSSGYTLSGFFDDALTSLPVFTDETNNLGIGNWDFFGHTPQVKIPIKTALEFRKTRNEKVIWTICYGINDCILYANIGNKTQQEITDYIYDYLVKSVEKIRQSYNDAIVLRVPNPMVARPYIPAAGFPSPTAYPTFGNDLNTDVALVDKWNSGIRNAYLKMQGKYNNTVVLDTHEKVFGLSNPQISQAQLPFMTDLVHPSINGYMGIVNEWVNLFKTNFSKFKAQKDRAERTAVLNTVDAWSVFPEIFNDNPKYSKVGEVRMTGAIGSNYVDLGMTASDFIKLTNTKPIYLVAPNVYAQKFEKYNIVETGPTTIRLIGVSPDTGIQGYNGNLQIYTDANDTIGKEAYLLTRINAIKPRFILWGKVSSAGVGYIDFGIDENTQLLGGSTKFLKGLEKGKLIVGGSVKTDVDLIGSTINRTGTTSQRAFRISKAGDNSALANSTACIVIENIYPLPFSYEGVTMAKKFGVTPLGQGNRIFIANPIKLFDGAKFYLKHSEIINTPITAELYKVTNSNSRTLIGTLTIPINTGTSNELTESVLDEGHIYEAVITSNQTSVTSIITLTLEPI